MFTGIVRGIGRIVSRQESGGDVRLSIDFSGVDMALPGIGDSVSVDGVCLTAATAGGSVFAADVSRETLHVTTLGQLHEGAGVNLEPALCAGDALGGHLVSGHVDGIGELLSRRADARCWRLRYAAPPELVHYLARKGSVAVDGVSLTINGVDDQGFEISVIPHTMKTTNIGARRPGDAVNLEVDQVARYLERLLEARE